jgi:hypothetical protein
VRYLVGVIVSLAFAAPAMAQEPAVGEPQVVTDQANQTEPAPDVTFEDDGSEITAVDDGTPAPEPPPDASGRRGEIHVLDAKTTSSPARATAVRAPAPAPAPARARQTLPFTGVDAGLVGLLGLALLAAGARLRAAVRQPQTF